MKYTNIALVAIFCISAMHSIAAHAGCYNPRLVIQAMATPDNHGSNPVVIAHRGIWRASSGTDIVAPENSLIALQKADQACIEAVELDVKSLADGTPIVMHDYNLGGMTNIGPYKGLPIFDPMTNAGYNPLVNEISPSDYVKLKLKDSRTVKKTGNSPAPSVKDVYDYYYNMKMSTVLVWDVKSKETAIAMAKLLDYDTRDYAHGTTLPPIRASDITVFKINATVYTNGTDYSNDMKNNGIGHAPKVIPIYTTNMEKIFNESHSSTLKSLENWSGAPGGYFLATEINLKQENGLLSNTMKFATDRNLSVGVFNALPDWLGGGTTAGSSVIPSNKAFVYNTGKCCYQLSDLYAEFNGKKDADDKRGDWNFIESQHFDFVTTDQADALISDLNTKGRVTDHYGVALWKSSNDAVPAAIFSWLLGS